MLEESADDRSIAIIGMAGRFPSAANIDELWELLTQGREARRTLSDADLRAAGVAEDLIVNPNYVKSEMIVPESSQFDAAFFSLDLKQAARIDPQQRMFLECAWEAFEDAGYYEERPGCAIGVFAGSGTSFHLIENINSPNNADSTIFTSVIDADKDFLTTRVSYKFNFTGPSIGVQTACSTSLVAVHLAAQSLLNFECDMAIAGGVSLNPRPGTGYLYTPKGVAASDGHCRAYDASATGMVTGSGAGTVVMKRLAEAIADGDNIHAVIRSSVINNDGADKVGFTAPGLRSQARMIATALAMAGVKADDIGMIEGHGTGTALGDMIELMALHDAFGKTERTGYCSLGSVKTNVGHLDCAAGVTGLIKAILCLKNRSFVPNLHYETPNDLLRSATTPFFVPTAVQPWVTSGDRPRRAGVSAMGIGGTNAHVIVEEAPMRVARQSAETHVFPLSARTPAALQEAQRSLAEVLRDKADELADVSYTLQVGRKTFAYRRAIVAETREELFGRLAEPAPHAPAAKSGGTILALSADTDGIAGFLPLLYDQDKIFRQYIDEFSKITRSILGYDVRIALLNGKLDQDQLPTALFATQYCLGRLWLKWGLTITDLVGEGVGEISSACLAEAISVEEGAKLLVSALFRDEGAAPAIASVAMASPRIPCFRLNQGKLYPAFDKSQPERGIASDAAKIAAPATLKVRRILETAPGKSIGQRIAIASNTEDATVYCLPQRAKLDRSDLLNLLAGLWESGASVEWTKHRLDTEPHRVSLPTYPFQRERCVVEEAPAALEKPADRSGPDDLGGWLYVPSLVATLNPPRLSSAVGKRVLILGESALAETIAGRLAELGASTVLVVSGEAFQQNGDHFVVRPSDRDDYKLLFDGLAADSTPPDIAIDCRSISDQSKDDSESLPTADASHLKLLFLMQAWHACHPLQSKAVLTLTHGLHETGGERPRRSMDAALAALCMVISQEQPKARCSVLDLPAGGRLEDCAKYVDWIISEVVQPGVEMNFAYRGNSRYAITCVPVRFYGSDRPIRVVKEDGVYLITGGMGAIGLSLSLYLATRYKARVALVSRTPLPPRNEWERLAADDTHPLSATLNRLVALEKVGGSIVALSADVSSFSELSKAVETIEQAWGPVNGVYHLAMSGKASTRRSWQDLLSSDFVDQMQPKLDGLQALQKVFSTRSLDFGIAFSSTSALLGGVGFGAYAAANAALDSAVVGSSQMVPDWISINWPGWQVMKPAHVAAFSDGGEYSKKSANFQDTVKPSEGFELLESIIAHSTVPQIVVHPGPLDQRLTTWARHRPRKQ